MSAKKKSKEPEELEGAMGFIAKHPAVRAASMSVAGTTAGMSFRRAFRRRTEHRLMWMAIAALELYLLFRIRGLAKSAQPA